MQSVWSFIIVLYEKYGIGVNAAPPAHGQGIVDEALHLYGALELPEIEARFCRLPL